MPQTRDFTLLMAQWDDLPDDAPPNQTGNLAAELRIAFDTARANAEAMGLKHLPDTAQPQARRAIKALLLAQNAGTPAERTVGLERAALILETLAIYYLPSPADNRRAIGGTLPAIEG